MQDGIVLRKYTSSMAIASDESAQCDGRVGELANIRNANIEVH